MKKFIISVLSIILFLSITPNLSAEVINSENNATKLDAKIELINFDGKYKVSDQTNFDVKISIDSKYEGTKTIKVFVSQNGDNIGTLEYYDEIRHEWRLPVNGQIGSATGFPIQNTSLKLRLTVENGDKADYTFSVVDATSNEIYARTSKHVEVVKTVDPVVSGNVSYVDNGTEIKLQENENFTYNEISGKYEYDKDFVKEDMPQGYELENIGQTVFEVIQKENGDYILVIPVKKIKSTTVTGKAFYIGTDYHKEELSIIDNQIFTYNEENKKYEFYKQQAETNIPEGYEFAFKTRTAYQAIEKDGEYIVRIFVKIKDSLGIMGIVNFTENGNIVKKLPNAGFYYNPNTDKYEYEKYTANLNKPDGYALKDENIMFYEPIEDGKNFVVNVPVKQIHFKPLFATIHFMEGDKIVGTKDRFLTVFDEENRNVYAYYQAELEKPEGYIRVDEMVIAYMPEKRGDKYIVEVPVKKVVPITVEGKVEYLENGRKIKTVDNQTFNYNDETMVYEFLRDDAESNVPQGYELINQDQTVFVATQMPDGDYVLTIAIRKTEAEVAPTPKPTTPTISCAGSKDKNCDGVVTCDEEKGAGWTWNNTKKVCEYTGKTSYQVVNTGVK